MGVQNRLDIANIPFLLQGPALTIDDGIILEYETRTEDLLAKTVLAFNPTSKKWVPWTDETATDGTQYPKGILTKDIAAADIAAGDVTGVSIFVGRMIVDVAQLVFENSLTIDTIVNIPAGLNTSAKDLLKQIDIFTETTVDVDSFENS